MTQISTIPLSVTHLTFPSDSCNEPELTELDLRQFGLLKSVVIGNNTLQHVVTIKEGPLMRLTVFDFVTTA